MALEDFTLNYEDLPNANSKLYTIKLRRIGFRSSNFVQRIIQRKNTNKDNGKSKGNIK